MHIKINLGEVGIGIVKDSNEECKKRDNDPNPRNNS